MYGQKDMLLQAEKAVEGAEKPRFISMMFTELSDGAIEVPKVTIMKVLAAIKKEKSGSGAEMASSE